MAKIRFNDSPARKAARERWRQETLAKRQAALPKVLFYLKLGYTHEQVARTMKVKNGFVANLLKGIKQNA